MKPIVIMIFCSALLALMAIVSQALIHLLPLATLTMLRFVLPMLLLWLGVWMMKNIKLDWQHWRIYALRAVFTTLTQLSLIEYLRYASVLNATLLYMSAPLFVPLLAYFCCQQKIRIQEVALLVLGFMGVVCVLQPGEGLLSWMSLIGLSAGFFNAASQVSLHRAVGEVSPAAATLGMLCFSSLFSFVVFLITTGFEPSVLTIQFNRETLALLLLLSLIILANQLLRAKAYSLVKKASNLTPYLYWTIVFSAIFDYMFKGVVPNAASLVGATLIVASGIMLKLKKEK